MASNPDLHLPARPFARYKDALVPRQQTPSLHSSPSCTTPSGRASGRTELHLLPAGPSPTEPIRRGPVGKCRSVTGWLLFARRLGSIVSSTVWPVRRPLHNDTGEAPGVPAGRRRLGHATALNAGLLLLPFKLCPPIHHTSRLHHGRPRPRQFVDLLRHRCVTTTSSCCRSPLRLGLVEGEVRLGADYAATRPMEKMPHRGDIQVRPHTAERWTGSCAVRNPTNDFKLS